MPRRNGRNGRRRTGFRNQRKVIRIYSEGIVTEPGYIAMLRRNYRSVSIDWVRGDSGKAATTLIDAAISYQQDTPASEMADEIWCLWDVDDLSAADITALEQKAARKNIRNVISNPCFELWLLLHYRDQTANLSGDDAQRQAQAAGLVQGKHICCCQDWLHRESATASVRAIRLEQNHVAVDSKACSNPSSGMHQLLRSIRGE